MKKILAISLLAFGFSTTAYASECTKPTIPSTLDKKEVANAFNESVKVYQDCVNKFVEDAKEKSKMWHEKAKKTADEWNAFIDEVNLSTKKAEKK